MPQPGCLRSPGHKAHRLPHVDVVVVEVQRRVLDLGEQLARQIVDLQYPTKYGNAAPDLVELANAQDARLQSWDIIYPCECAVFTILAGEGDSSPALDLGHRSITELDLATDLCLELGEEMMTANHVICGSRVQYPSTIVTFLQWP
jgi:hypothetical protein